MRRSALEEGRRWLDQAEEDLRWTNVLAQQGANHLACFLAQQVTEKALKAFLFAQGEEIVLGNSVERLCSAAFRYNQTFDEKVKRWSLLDGYYITTRYPNSLPDGIPANVFTQDAALSAVTLAEEAVDWVRQLLDAQGEKGS